MEGLNGIPLTGCARWRRWRRGDRSPRRRKRWALAPARSASRWRAPRRCWAAAVHRRPEGLRPTAAAPSARLSTGFGGSPRRGAGRPTGSGADDFGGAVFALWLIWRLPGFQAAHPEIQVGLDNQLGLADPNTSDVDICMRVGRGLARGRGPRLFSQYVVPVCAPAWRRASPAGGIWRVPIIREPRPQFGWEFWRWPEGLDPAALPKGRCFPTPRSVWTRR